MTAIPRPQRRERAVAGTGAADSYTRAQQAPHTATLMYCVVPPLLRSLIRPRPLHKLFFYLRAPGDLLVGASMLCELDIPTTSMLLELYRAQ